MSKPYNKLMKLNVLIVEINCSPSTGGMVQKLKRIFAIILC